MHFLTPSIASSATSSSRPLPEDVVSDAEVIAAWEAIDFSNFQVSLEDQASQIVDMQENRINQRKELAEKTQTLRTGPEVPAHAVDLIPSLLILMPARRSRRDTSLRSESAREDRCVTLSRTSRARSRDNFCFAAS